MFFIGLTLESQGFKVALLKREKKKVSVELLTTFSHSDAKDFYTLAPFHTGKGAQIASGLPSSEVFIRRLHLPLGERRKILAALPFQIENLIPFPTEEAVVCPLLKPVSKQMTSVTFIAAKRAQIKEHLASLKALDIQPHVLSCQSAAMVRFGAWRFPEEPKILSFDVREGKMTCSLVEGGELILSQTLPFCERIEIDKLSVFLKQKGAIDEHTPWLLTGESGWEEAIGSVFIGPRLALEEPELASYAIAIGFALDALADDGARVQFCQREFTSEPTFASRKKHALSYLTVCVGAALVMALGGNGMLGKKQRLLVERLEKHLPAASRSTPEEIQSALIGWEKSLSKDKTPFPFLPTVPKVSDVLAWLSAHPAFATEEGAQKEEMQLQSLHYSLVKYPKVGEASVPYSAQVSLEFCASMPRAARDFHEALLKGDQIVNGKKEIKWHTQNQTYQTSFELKRVGAP